MSQFSHSQKIQFIVRDLENQESDANKSALSRAATEIGIGRTRMYTVRKNKDILSDSDGLDKAFAKRVAEPGSESYQKLFAEVSSALKRREEDDKAIFDACYLDLAYDTWASRALQTDRPDASRLLYGRLAEMVLFDAGKMLPRAPLCERDAAAFKTRGREVIDNIMELLARNEEPPDGFFVDKAERKHKDSTMKAAVVSAPRRAGYRIFKIRMQSDHIGWYHDHFDDDRKRVDLMVKAFNAGLHADLTWLHSILGEEDEIAWANGAWVLAMHAGEWATSARSAVALFEAFPKFLDERVMGLKSVSEDRTVWPGLAAIMAHREIHELDVVRDRLSVIASKAMMESLLKMKSVVLAKQSYLDVLKAGDIK